MILQDYTEQLWNTTGSNNLTFMRYTPQDITRHFPATGWIMLNPDNASKGMLSNAGCGCPIQGKDLNWLMGFTYHLGSSTTYNAELWGI